MNYEDLKKIFFEHKSASITAKINESSPYVSMDIKGRGVELMSLLLTVTEKIVRESPLSIDDYCKILKKGTDINEKEKNMELFNKLFNDIREN